MTGFLSGFFLGFSLILAIGAQNAFILKQGLLRQHVFLLCMICALSDAILINVGVFSFSFFSKRFSVIEPVARYGGAAFLFYYGARSYWAAFKKSNAMRVAVDSNASVESAVLMCLALTWLNPHVYLDTMMLIGSVSTQYPSEKVQFAVGASLASFVFFFSLGYGARLLAPVFRQPRAWKVLDGFIGTVMWGIATNLLLA